MHALDMHNVYMSSKYDGFKMIISKRIEKSSTKYPEFHFGWKPKERMREKLCACVWNTSIHDDFESQIIG